MTEQDIRDFKLSLLAFVKRASEKGATAEEVEALPAVANALTHLIDVVGT